MIINDRKTIESWYDRAVTSAGVDGIAPSEVKPRLVEMWIESAKSDEKAAALGDELLGEIAAMVIAHHVGAIRQNRNKTKSRNIGSIIDAIIERWLDRVDQGNLDRAYPIGNGRDKALGDWTAVDVDDWLAASDEALAEATASHERNVASHSYLSVRLSGSRTIRELWSEAQEVVA